VVDRRLHDDLRKTYLHVRAPRFDLHRLGDMVANSSVNHALTPVEAWGRGDQGVRRMQIAAPVPTTDKVTLPSLTLSLSLHEGSMSRVYTDAESSNLPSHPLGQPVCC
jgi:hypothetical protein